VNTNITRSAYNAATLIKWHNNDNNQITQPTTATPVVTETEQKNAYTRKQQQKQQKYQQRHKQQHNRNTNQTPTQTTA